MEERIEMMSEREETENKEILNKINKINTRMNLLNQLLLRVEQEIEKKENITEMEKKIETINETENKESSNKRVNLLNQLLLQVDQEIVKKDNFTNPLKKSSNKYGVVTEF